MSLVQTDPDWAAIILFPNSPKHCQMCDVRLVLEAAGELQVQLRCPTCGRKTWPTSVLPVLTDAELYEECKKVRPETMVQLDGEVRRRLGRATERLLHIPAAQLEGMLELSDGEIRESIKKLLEG